MPRACHDNGKRAVKAIQCLWPSHARRRWMGGL